MRHVAGENRCWDRVLKVTPTARTTAAAWRTQPTWYAVSMQDRTINSDLQRFMAKRMKANMIELPASHVSLLSRPQEVAGLILEAATRVTGEMAGPVSASESARSSGRSRPRSCERERI